MHLPFEEQDYEITEGWFYSDEEKAIHGFTTHGAIDFKLERGTPVLAAAEGLAVSSYFSYLLKKEGKPLLYNDKPMGFGLGYFVQIYHSQQDLFTTYAHLERVADEIKFHASRGHGDYIWPVGHKVDPSKLPRYRWGTKVERGQVVGYVGDSGITWGYVDYPRRPDPEKFPSWDEVHLHFEVFRRVGVRKKKKMFDPYGIQGKTEDYPDSYKKGKGMGAKGAILWALDEKGLPKLGLRK